MACCSMFQLTLSETIPGGSLLSDASKGVNDRLTPLIVIGPEVSESAGTNVIMIVVVALCIEERRFTVAVVKTYPS